MAASVIPLGRPGRGRSRGADPVSCFDLANFMTGKIECDWRLGIVRMKLAKACVGWPLPWCCSHLGEGRNRHVGSERAQRRRSSLVAAGNEALGARHSGLRRTGMRWGQAQIDHSGGLGDTRVRSYWLFPKKNRTEYCQQHEGRMLAVLSEFFHQGRVFIQYFRE